MAMPMLSPRLRKLVGDVASEKGRLALLAIAVAVSLAAVGAVLGAFAILTREIRASYLATRPASATIEMEGDVDDEVLALARAHPRVKEAEAREVILGRARVGVRARPLLIFVIDDFADVRLATMRPVDGAYPPADGELVLERSALPVLETAIGRELVVQTPAGAPRALRVAGVVHDPALAPASQERTGYAYISRATAGLLGEDAALHELRVLLHDEGSLQTVEAGAANVAASLDVAGHHVHQIRVPPPKQHPHQRQMTTILLMMLAFAGLSLLLSAVLVATSLASLLGRQVREIGVMKTVGATSGQIAALYTLLIGGLSVVAVLLSLPAAAFVARRLAGMVAGLLNFDLADVGLPWWVTAVQVVAGVVVPLAMAAVPLRAASRVPVREALDQHGVAASSVRVNVTMLPMAARNLVRRPARTALVLALLSTGGAIFQSALHVARAWTKNLEKVDAHRDYDVEVRLSHPPSPALLTEMDTLSSIDRLEVWGFSPAAFTKPGEIDVVRTWPDRGHGSLAVMAPPAGSRLTRFPLLAGRWLTDSDVDAVVLNHGALAQRPGLQPGDEVRLSLDGVPSTWRLVGVVEEVGASGIAYVPLASFAALVDHGRLLRLASSTPADAVAQLDRLLLDEQVPVELLLPLSELEAAVDGHIALLIESLLALAFVIAVVGSLGLASTMSVNVLERTRELGIMLAIGATPRRLRWLVLGEGVAVAVAGWVLGVLLSLPLTAGLDALVGSLGFLAALPFVLDLQAPIIWLVVLVAGAVAATWLPARSVTRLSVRDALARP